MHVSVSVSAIKSTPLTETITEYNILVMEHADVRPCFTSDFQQDLQTEKCARSLERCSNFSNQNSRRAAIARLQ